MPAVGLRDGHGGQGGAPGRGVAGEELQDVLLWVQAEDSSPERDRKSAPSGQEGGKQGRSHAQSRPQGPQGLRFLTVPWRPCGATLTQFPLPERPPL